jgi:hypothetical protein
LAIGLGNSRIDWCAEVVSAVRGQMKLSLLGYPTFLIIVMVAFQGHDFEIVMPFVCLVAAIANCANVWAIYSMTCDRLQLGFGVVLHLTSGSACATAWWGWPAELPIALLAVAVLAYAVLVRTFRKAAPQERSSSS